MIQIGRVVESMPSTNNSTVFNRLVVFGCSHTIGQFLPGWEPVPDEQGILSNLTWSNHLAEYLNIPEIVNKASGGNSNHEILLNILNFKFLPGDLCVICWSYATREILFDDHDDTGCIRTSVLLHVNKDDTFFKVHSMHDLEFRSREYINHATLLLKSVGIEYRMGKIENWVSNKNINWSDYSYDDFLSFVISDFGSDGCHPGVISHKKFAKKIYESFK